MTGLFSQRLLLCPLTVAVCSRWTPVYETKIEDFSKHLLQCPLRVAVCSRWMPFIYENRHQDSFSNVYCYLPWQSQFCSWLMPSVYFHKCQDSFPNIYCYVTWQSQFVLDGCLAFMKINARTLFRTSTAMSFDSRSFFSMDAWRLWK